MSDDKTKVAHDAKLISLTEEYELDDWTASLGCTRDQLRAAVAAVGHSAEAVRAWLAENPATD